MDFEIIKKSLRLIAITRKPDNDEFSRIAKITGAGIVAIGIIGLAISFAFNFI